MALPIIPWIGGKRRLADRIIPQFPPHTCYVEVFAGGAALYFMRPPAEVQVLNDVNGERISRWQTLPLPRLVKGFTVIYDDIDEKNFTIDIFICKYEDFLS